MTEQITPLRRRMIEDMSLRNMSPATQCAYVSAVRNFSDGVDAPRRHRRAKVVVLTAT
jgi:hypothetical protein